MSQPHPLPLPPLDSLQFPDCLLFIYSLCTAENTPLNVDTKHQSIKPPSLVIIVLFVVTRTTQSLCLIFGGRRLQCCVMKLTCRQHDRTNPLPKHSVVVRVHVVCERILSWLHVCRHCSRGSGLLSWCSQLMASYCTSGQSKVCATVRSAETLCVMYLF